MSNKKKAASTPNGGDGLNTSGKDIIKAIRTQIILLNYPTQYDEIWVNVKTNRICLIKWDVFGKLQSFPISEIDLFVEISSRRECISR